MLVWLSNTTLIAVYIMTHKHRCSTHVSDDNKSLINTTHTHTNCDGPGGYLCNVSISGMSPICTANQQPTAEILIPVGINRMIDNFVYFKDSSVYSLIRSVLG